MITLPEAGVWQTPEELASYAVACLQALGLEGWDFGWDRARQRLGCCWYRRRRITLSRLFVEQYLHGNPELLRRTLLHELAHALAWVYFGHARHGAVWRNCCAELGIPGERATCRREIAEPLLVARRPRYVLYHAETGEVYRTYVRRPRRWTPRQLKTCYLPGRKEETLGFLRLREVDKDE